MRAIETKIGDARVLIETIAEDVNVIAFREKEKDRGRQTVTTSVQDDIMTAYDNLKAVIGSIAEDIGQRLRSLTEEARPKQTEMEINLGFSGEANAWIVTGKAEAALKLKMIWEPSENG